ncbi:MAG: hypothetical protein ACRDF4_04455 [Rhabdochlamydiaceae bacterium]
MSEAKTAELVKSRAKSPAKLRGWASDTFPSIIAFVAIDLALTLIFFGFSSASAHVGTLRPEATIAPKVLELAAVGAGVGLIASLASRAFDFSFVTFGAAFMVLLDLDHLPSVFGIDQPIRPAHSLAFLAITVVVLYFIAGRSRPEVPVIATATFMAHIASDTGVFAFYAPISFSYISLNEFRVPLAIGAVCFAIIAGYLKSTRRLRRQLSPALTDSVGVKGVIKKK